MKRKLLLTCLTVALFALVLSICASASVIYKDAQGNEIFSYETKDVKITPVDTTAATLTIIDTYTGEFAKTDENGVHLTWYITATATEGGNTVHTVACVPTLQADGYEAYAGTLNSNGGYSYVSAVNKKKVVSASFPDNAGIKTFAFGAYGGYGSRSQNNILFCYLPNTITALDDSIFQETPVMTVEIDDEAPMTAFPAKFAHAAWNIRGEVHIPASVERIKTNGGYQNGTTFFQTYCLESVTFSASSKLKTVDSFAFAISGVKYVTLPDTVESVGNKAFVDSGIINGPFTENSRCTTWGNHIFRNCDSLKSFIVPATLTTIGKHDKADESEFALSDNIDIITFAPGANDATMFASFFANASIKKVVLPEGITHIPARMFQHCKDLTRVEFPNSVKTAGERVFESSSVQQIVFGAGFEGFVNGYSDHFSLTYGANNVKEIYIPASFYAKVPEITYQVSYAFNCGSSSNIKFFYTGSEEELATAITNFKTQTSATDNNYKFLGATPISYAEYILDKDSYAKGNYIIFDYNACDAFYNGVHKDDSNTCVINCPQCKTYGVMEENPEHKYQTTISYANGYASLGEILKACTNEGCICAEPTKESAAPIFGGFEYSTKIDTSYVGLVLSYDIDPDAIAKYEEITGKTLSYGVLAVAKDGVKTSEPFVNGAPQDCVIATDVSSYGVTRVDFVIRGSADQWNQPLEGDESKTVKDMDFYILGFIDDGNINYFYDTSFSQSVKTLTSVTYNQIEALSAGK